uniref:uncharacterized protein n=1 Tax=Myxine glutinosa TaxID=7769 RepID=UPI00358E3DCC
MDSMRARRGLCSVPAWLEFQGLSEESLRAVVTGLGVAILGGLCTRAEPAPARVRFRALSARRFTFTFTMYAELCRYMESWPGAEWTVVPGHELEAGGPPGMARMKEEDEDSVGTEDEEGDSEDDVPRAININMAPKKTKKTATETSARGRGRGKKNTPTPSSSPSSSKAADPPAHDLPAVPQAGCSQSPRSPSPHSGDGSRASHASSVDSDAASVASTSSRQSDDKTKKKKRRAKKTACSLSVQDEELMLEFLQDNPVLWNMKMMDYRRTDKKGKIWEDQAQRMGKTSELLRGWFKSLRDNHTRLDKKKSGDGAPELTEREEWIMAKFGFLKTVIRHRPEPCNSVKATIDAHEGDLDAAEAACAEQQVGRKEADIIPTLPSSSRRKRAHDDDGALLESLQKRVQESGEILKGLSHAHQQPITERTAFATYVHDSLISMSKPKFRKTRSAINKMLSQLMEEDSDDDIPSSMGGPAMPQLRPSSAPSSYVSSPSEMYQPPPHM